MYGVSIDDRPDSPVGSPDVRRTIAIHWEWTSEHTREEMATALGVQKSTIDRYVRDGPTNGVKEQLADVETEVRLIAVQELRQQLKEAGHHSKTAESPSEVWQDENGDVRVRTVTDDEGEVVEKVPVPDNIELLPDQEARYYARAEVRDIIDQLTDLLGVGEPEQVEVTGEGGGPIVIHTEADDGDR